jgi:hypothetical protein
MKTTLTFIAAVAECLTASGLITATVFSAEDPLPEHETPALGLLTEGVENPHSALVGGNLVLRYEFDADTTTALAAATDLTAATDYLLSDAGRAALQAILKPSSIWLRILAPATDPSTAPAGERTRTHQVSVPFWIQTYL